VLFGPDRNGDGLQDLYVTSADVHEGGSFQTSRPHASSVKVYDGVTGAYLSDFIAVESGGLNMPILMTFTQTDPVTLAYRGGDPLTAAPLLAEVLARRPSAGVDASALPGIDLRSAEPGGRTAGVASGHTSSLDDNAVGRGWLADATPHDDSEVRTPGEPNRTDLLTVLVCEMGHVPGHLQ
jgi:hypothetical protein